MLDIRATHYVSPLSEVEFTDVPLTVHLVNAADETGYVTGRFRVYNDTTHELIFDSLIAPFSLLAGQPVDVSALTDFSPPAPLDDTYFVLFDGNASNALVPRGISFSLGAFHFDVKPGPLGEPPEAHAPTHEQDGADPIETADLGTAELDDTLVLKPDGAGGVEWVASPAGVTDHGDLTGLDADDHPQYRQKAHLYLSAEALIYSSLAPWLLAAIGSGTLGEWSAYPNHPGIAVFTSSVNANSGYRAIIGASSLHLAGAEVTELVIRPMTLTDTTIRFGFHDSNSVTPPVDGAYIYQDPATGKISGRTMSASVGSTTGTDYQLVTNTWYREKIVVNHDATSVDFYLYAEDGTLLWTDWLTTNIPTGAGRQCGHGVVATNAGTTPVSLCHIDVISLEINRALVR